MADTPDLDGDGLPDVVSIGNAGLWIARGRAPAELAAPVVVPILWGQAVESADFDGDGRLDLVVGRPNDVMILRNQGDGSFDASAPSTVTLPGYPGGSGSNGLTVGDFDGDGAPDIAIIGETEISVFSNLGDGTFDVPDHLRAPPPPAGWRVSRLTAVDIDADGHLDLLASALWGSVELHRNRGDGTFAEPRVVPVAGSPWSFQAADFDGDGRPELLASGGGYPYGAAIYPVQSDLTLSARTDIGAGEAFVGDVDRDGRPDILLGDYYKAVVRRSLGNGTFAPPVVVPVGFNAILALADFDGDGWLDIASGGFVRQPTPAFPGFVSLHRGRPGGAFDAPPLSQPSTLPRLDVDGDGVADKVYLVEDPMRPGDDADSCCTHHAAFARGLAAGGFAPPVQWTEHGENLVTSDVDGDGDVDVVLDSWPVGTFYENDGAGHLAPRSSPLAQSVREVLLADLDGDGLADRIQLFTDGVSVERALGARAFGPAHTYAAGMGSVAIGDLDADGRPELLIAQGRGLSQDQVTHEYTVLHNLGDGTFEPSTTALSGSFPRAVLVDIDGDGHVDVVDHEPEDGTVSVFFGRGNLELEPRIAYEVKLPSPMRVFDRDGDGVLDLVFGGEEATESVVRGRAPACGSAPGPGDAGAPRPDAGRREPRDAGRESAAADAESDAPPPSADASPSSSPPPHDTEAGIAHARATPEPEQHASPQAAPLPVSSTADQGGCSTSSSSPHAESAAALLLLLVMRRRRRPASLGAPSKISESRAAEGRGPVPRA